MIDDQCTYISLHDSDEDEMTIDHLVPSMAWLWYSVLWQYTAYCNNWLTTHFV